MITGFIPDARRPLIRLTVLGPHGEQEVDAIIDTGFDGWLTLPFSTIIKLGLPWRQRGRALLADGTETVFDIYDGTVVWDGQPRRVAIDRADTDPLLGMRMLHGYELKVQVVNGGEVTIRRLS